MGKLISLIGEKEVNQDRYPYWKKKKVSMHEVQNKLREWNIEYDIKGSNHIKIGRVNFYPSTGTCYVDGAESSFRKKDLNFLKEVIIREGMIF